MQGNWSFSKEILTSPNDLDLRTRPSCIRPETDWMHKEVRQGGFDDRLWFSLQLSRNRAEELCDAFAGFASAGDFGELINSGALMAPSSYAALRFAIATVNAGPGRSQEPGSDPMDRMLGTDILVPPDACNSLQRLLAPGILEITDAGLALKTDEAPAPIKLDPEIRQQSPVLQDQIPCGSPVIIAIVDDGIGIANHRFRETATTTRVRHFLDQSLVGTPTAAGADELLGRSWTAAQINDLLGAYPDEERIYRALGLIDTRVALRQPLRAAVSHGTHVLDTAAGYDWRTEKKELDKRPIIAVQPPIQAAENRSDPWMPLSLKRALDWILVKADELSAEITGGEWRLPLIVNCSFSSMAGPQDGWSDVERRITQFVRTYRADGPAELCTMVMSAGNTLQLRAAARVPIDIGKKHVSLPWRVKPDDRTPSFVQIWLPPQPRGTPQQVRVALRPPGQDNPVTFSMLDKALDWTVGGSVRARIYHQSWSRPADEQRECITIAIRATDDDGVPTPVVPAGLWHIDIEPTEDLQGPLCIDLHVHRDDVGLFARGKGRQSYFDDPHYPRVELIGDYQQGKLVGRRSAADSEPLRPGRRPFVTEEGTLNAYGYGEGTMLVAGYRDSDGEPAAYSASGKNGRKRRGLIGRPVDDGPDLAAVTDESPSLPGILASGTYSGSVARLNGTSVAAPQVVRALAEKIACHGSVATLKDDMVGAAKPQPGVSQGEKPKPQEDRPLRLGEGRLKFKPTHRNAD